MASVQQVASHAATILCSPSLHFNLESIVHLSDIALALRHAHNIARINKSFPFLFSVFFYFSRRKERNNICFVNYAPMILLVFFSLPPPLTLSRSFSIYLSIFTGDDKSRYPSCPLACCLRRCFRGSIATPAREKRLSFHGNTVTLWHLSTLRAVAGV